MAEDDWQGKFVERTQVVAKEIPNDQGERKFHESMTHVVSTWISTNYLLFGQLSRESVEILGNAALRADWELVENFMRRDHAVSQLCAMDDGIHTLEDGMSMYRAQAIPYVNQLAEYRRVWDLLSEDDQKILQGWEFWGTGSIPRVRQPWNEVAMKTLFEEFPQHLERIWANGCERYVAGTEYEIVRRRRVSGSGDGFGVMSMETRIRSIKDE